MLVGNKSDLATKYRRVTYEQSSVFAHQNRCSFMEVSARKNAGIQEAFETLIKSFLHINPTIIKKNVALIQKIDDKNKLSKKNKSFTTKKESRDCIIM